MNSPDWALFLLDGLARLIKRGGGHLDRTKGDREEGNQLLSRLRLRLGEIDLVRFDVADGHSHIQLLRYGRDE